MPEISRFFGIVIAMYYREHAPPHFHAIYSGQEAVIHIQTLALAQGGLPPRVLGLVMEWASLHRDELLEDWALAEQMQPLKSVEPLQ